MIDELKQRLINRKNSGRLYTDFNEIEQFILLKFIDKLEFIKKDFKCTMNMPIFIFDKYGNDELIQTNWYIYHSDLGYIYKKTDGNFKLHCIIPEFYGISIDLNQIFN